MLDLGLLATGAAMWAVLVLAARWAPMGDGESVVDRLLLPVLAGLVAARLAAVLLDDPASLRSLRSLLVIRGGVEFWPGAAVVALVLAWSLRRRAGGPMLGLADLAPFLLWGYATYEAMCLARDGCYGPSSVIGLAPDGLRIRMFPVGLAAAAATTALGLALWRLRVSSWLTRILLAVGGLAAVRALAAVWLPQIGDGPSRQQVQSAAVAVAVATVGLGRGALELQRRRDDRLAPAHQPTPAEGAV